MKVKDGNMSYLDELEKMMKDGSERWQQIERLHKEISGQLHTYDPGIRSLVELQLLLIDHLRPITPTKKQIDDANREIKDILSNFLKK